MNKFRFKKVRDVKSPTRGHIGDAGIDFYFPVDLTESQLKEANENVEGVFINTPHHNEGFIHFQKDENDHITQLTVGPHARIIIPSGICGLLEPLDSALVAANKSGISTKRGLIFTAEVVDSPYVGEIHICLANTSGFCTHLNANEKITQFLHLPVYQTIPEEITSEEYDQEAENWGERGKDWQGSTDNK